MESEECCCASVQFHWRIAATHLRAIPRRAIVGKTQEDPPDGAGAGARALSRLSARSRRALEPAAATARRPPAPARSWRSSCVLPTIAREELLEGGVAAISQWNCTDRAAAFPRFHFARLVLRRESTCSETPRARAAARADQERRVARPREQPRAVTARRAPPRELRIVGEALRCRRRPRPVEDVLAVRVSFAYSASADQRRVCTGEVARDQPVPSQAHPVREGREGTRGAGTAGPPRARPRTRIDHPKRVDDSQRGRISFKRVAIAYFSEIIGSLGGAGVPFPM